MTSPRVQAIADLHGYLPHTSEVPECDLLLIAGDICPDYHQMSKARYGTDRKHNQDKGEQRQRHWLDTVFREWLEIIVARGTTVVACWGNHDFIGEHPFLVPDLPWILLQDMEVTVHGLRIWGTPWTPNLRAWAFQLSDEANMARVENIPNGLDILMSHGPAYGLRDFVAPQFGSKNVGDTWLRLEFDRGRLIVPTLVCGHIHEERGLSSHVLPDGSTMAVVNVAHMDETYSVGRGFTDISNLVVK